MKTYQMWVKKQVSKKDWASTYSQSLGYSWLGENAGNVIMGFLIGRPADKEEVDLLNDRIALCNDDELRRIDLHRRAANCRPYPLT
jgi:hypothetical protein